VISNRLRHFSKYTVHKCKQRLTKITQHLIRVRKLQLKVRPAIVSVNKCVRRWGPLDFD
jgi:protein MAK16